MRKIFLILAFAASTFTTKAQTPKEISLDDIITEGGKQFIEKEAIKQVKEMMSAIGKDATDLGITNVTVKSIDKCKIVYNYTIQFKDKQGKILKQRFEEILPTNINRITSRGERTPGHFIYDKKVVVSNFEDGTLADEQYVSTLRFDESQEFLSRLEHAVKILASLCENKK